MRVVSVPAVLLRPSLATSAAGVDAIVERWHGGASRGDGMHLHEYLGWTWEEYRGWVERGELPPFLPAR